MRHVSLLALFAAALQLKFYYNAYSVFEQLRPLKNRTGCPTPVAASLLGAYFDKSSHWSARSGLSTRGQQLRCSDPCFLYDDSINGFNRKEEEMKKWTGLMMVLFLVVFGVAACGEDTQTNGRAERPVEDQQQPLAREDSPPAVMEPMERAQEPGQQVGQIEQVRGTLIETDEGVTIFSDRGNFVVEGQDVSGLVGRDVMVTGTIEEREGTQIIEVTSVSVIE
jgi:hypothetical protein